MHESRTIDPAGNDIQHSRASVLIMLLDGTGAMNEYVTRSVLDLIALLATFSNTSLCALFTYVTEDLRGLDDPVARLDEVPNQSRTSAWLP